MPAEQIAVDEAARERLLAELWRVMAVITSGTPWVAAPLALDAP